MKNSKLLKDVILGGAIFIFISGIVLLVGCNKNADSVLPGAAQPVTGTVAFSSVTFYNNGAFSGFGWNPGGTCSGQKLSNGQLNPNPITDFQLWNNPTVAVNLSDPTYLLNGESVMSFAVTALPGPIPPVSGQYAGWGAVVFQNPNWCQNSPNDVTSYVGNYTQCTFWAQGWSPIAGGNVTAASQDIEFGAMGGVASYQTLTGSWQEFTLPLTHADFQNVGHLFYIGFGGTPPYTIYVGDIEFH